MASDVCSKLYGCATAAQLAAAGLPASEAACVTNYEASQGCAAQTEQNFCVNGNASFNGDEAGVCIDQIPNITCGEILDANFVLTVSAPACGQICQIAH